MYLKTKLIKYQLRSLIKSTDQDDKPSSASVDVSNLPMMATDSYHGHVKVCLS